METHFLLTAMQYADDYGFLGDQDQQIINLMNREFLETDVHEDMALGLLEDNFTYGEINSSHDHRRRPSIPVNLSNSASGMDQRPAKQSKTSGINDQIRSTVLSNEKMEIASAPSPLLSSNDSTPSSRQEAKLKCPNRGQSHIMAERMRRERLTERFIALSALIPGLKKNDKGSVLSEAIKYVKQLQQRVDLLEEQKKELSSGAHPSVVFVKNSNEVSSSRDEVVSNISSNSGSTTVHGNSSSNNGTVSYESLPEVEAKVLGKEVIIRIHCRKHKEVLMNVLRELEHCHLVVVSSNVTPFANSFVDITIVAQMEKEEDMVVVNVVATNLGFALSALEY